MVREERVAGDPRSGKENYEEWMQATFNPGSIIYCVPSGRLLNLFNLNFSYQLNEDNKSIDGSCENEKPRCLPENTTAS